MTPFHQFPLVLGTMKIEDGKLRLEFDHVGSGLASKDGKPLSWFEIIDADEGGFVQATAEIDGNTVVLSAPSVKHPVAMLCEGLFPSSRSIESLDGEEEERRLFYVAITRARNELYLSYPIFRIVPGVADALQQPSRFLKELPKDLIEEWNLRTFNPYGQTSGGESYH